MVDYEYIKLKMAAKGITKFNVDPITITVNKPHMLLPLNKYFYLFCSTMVSAPEFTKIELKSRDNYLVFSPALLAEMSNAQYQFFSEELKIDVSQFGSDNEADFKNIRLEFIKITPEE